MRTKSSLPIPTVRMVVKYCSGEFKLCRDLLISGINLPHDYKSITFSTFSSPCLFHPLPSSSAADFSIPHKNLQ